MSVRRFSFYVTDVDVTIRSDHLPLKKFLNKQTMNSKVKNWAVELEQFRFHLEWITVSWNLLADSLSSLIDVVPDAKQPDELKDHEFGSYCFKELEPTEVLDIVLTDIIEMQDAAHEGIEGLIHSQRLTEMREVETNCGKKPPSASMQSKLSKCSECLQGL